MHGASWLPLARSFGHPDLTAHTVERVPEIGNAGDVPTWTYAPTGRTRAKGPRECAPGALRRVNGSVYEQVSVRTDQCATGVARPSAAFSPSAPAGSGASTRSASSPKTRPYAV